MTRAGGPRRLDVGIIGAGFAGTATALFLARAGHRVTLYEESASPSAVGAGILIQPSGAGAPRARLARRLGEHELVVVADGARSELRDARDATGLVGGQPRARRLRLGRASLAFRAG